MCKNCITKTTTGKLFTCPTQEPGQRRAAVRFVQQCGIDLVSMFDCLTVPREHVAIVTLRADTPPNSAVSWGDYKNVAACEQMFFIDTRRSVSQMLQCVANTMFVNHTAMCYGVPTFERAADRAVAERECQCMHNRCPGSQHRARVILQRTYGRASAASKEPALCNLCPLTSTCYDKDLTMQISGVMASTVTDSVDFAVRLANWQIHDATTHMPLLPESPDSKKNLKLEFVIADKTAWRTLRFDKPVAEQCVSLPPIPETDNLSAPSSLTMHAVDIDDVLARRARSQHSPPLCCGELKMFQALLKQHVTLDRVIADVCNDVQRMFQEKTLFKAKPAASDEENYHVDASAALNSMVSDYYTDLVLSHAGEERHAADCSCLFEQFLRRRCTQQIDLLLVPTPLNNLYRQCGDSIYNIESPLMRELGVHGAIIKAKIGAPILGLGAELLDIVVDRHADNGDPQHFDSVIVSNADLRRTMRGLFGTFESLGKRRFRSTEKFPQSQHAFVTYLARNGKPTVRRYGDVFVHEKLAHLKTYEDVLHESKLVFGAHDEIESLTELLLFRGKLRDPSAWRTHEDWLVPALRYLIEAACKDVVGNVEEYAINMLTLPDNKRRIFTTSCERVIVEELLETSNWRLALARCAAAVLTDQFSMVIYRQTIVHAVCLIMVADQLQELGAHRRVHPPPPPLPPPPPVPPPKKEKPPPKKRVPVKTKLISPPPTPTAAKKAKIAPPSPKKPAPPPVDNWVTVGAKGKALPPPKQPSLDEFMRAEANIDFFDLQSVLAYEQKTGIVSAPTAFIVWDKLPAFRFI